MYYVATVMPRPKKPPRRFVRWGMRFLAAVGAITITLIGAFLAAIFALPSTSDMFTGEDLEIEVAEGSAYSAYAPVEVRALQAEVDSSDDQNVYTSAKQDGAYVSAAMVSLILHNEASGQMRLTSITIVPTSYASDVVDRSLVVIVPDGAGGGSDRLLLGGSLDDPKRSLASFDPISGKRDNSNYFKDHTFIVDPGTTEPVDVKVEARRVSGTFALRIDYLYRGEEKTVTTDTLGTVTGPACDKEGQLTYRNMIFVSELSYDPLDIDATDETAASMAIRLADVGKLC